MNNGLQYGELLCRILTLIELPPGLTQTQPVQGPTHVLSCNPDTLIFTIKPMQRNQVTIQHCNNFMGFRVRRVIATNQVTIDLCG